MAILLLKGINLMQFAKQIFIFFLSTVIISATEITKYTSLNPADEIRLFSDYVVDTTDVVSDKIRIAGGDLTVNGTITGKITVYGGTININSTAVIDGEIIAVGGIVNEHPDAVINGKIVEINLREGLVYREKEGDPAIEGSTEFHIDERFPLNQKSWVHPEISPFVYNRNEGLLLSFNTYWDRHGKSNLRFSINAGYRFSHKTFAGRITLEQAFFQNKNLIFFGSAFREANTDDGWRLKDSENSVATLLAKQDFIDRWDETGYEYGIGADLNWFKLKATKASVVQDEIPVSSNLWTLFHKDRLFRPNLIDTSYNQDLYRAVLAFKPIAFGMFDTGFAFYIKAEQSVDNTYSRLCGLAKTQLRVYDDYVIKTRFMAGTSTGDLPGFRSFGVGGLGSIAAHDYKAQSGNQFAQLNIEILLTPEFMDEDFTFILFADAGHAWDREDYGFYDKDELFNNGISSAGIGISFFDDDDFAPRINFARSLNGTDIWETTIRMDFNF